MTAVAVTVAEVLDAVTLFRVAGLRLQVALVTPAGILCILLSFVGFVHFLLLELLAFVLLVQGYWNLGYLWLLHNSWLSNCLLDYWSLGRLWLKYPGRGHGSLSWGHCILCS